MSAIDLKIKSVIGFSGIIVATCHSLILCHLFLWNLGKVPGSIKYSNDGRYIVFPLGSFVVVKNTKTGKEAFLDGHSGEITCIDVSHAGDSIASGQSGPPGVKVSLSYVPCFKAIVKWSISTFRRT